MERPIDIRIFLPNFMKSHVQNDMVMNFKKNLWTTNEDSY